MVFENDGIEELGKHIRNEPNPQTPKFLSFAGNDNTYTGTESVLVNEFIRKEVTWVQTGIQSKYTVELSSTEAIGSTISTTGLVGGSDIGSDVLFTSNRSFIGPKTSSFNVQLEGEIIIRRPSQ